MDMMDTVADVLAGKLRYQLWRRSDDRCYYRSSASLRGMARDIQFALDDNCDGFVRDTRSNRNIPLEEAIGYCF